MREGRASTLEHWMLARPGVDLQGVASYPLLGAVLQALDRTLL